MLSIRIDHVHRQLRALGREEQGVVAGPEVTATQEETAQVTSLNEETLAEHPREADAASSADGKQLC